jgi:hypothetical protein
MFDALRHLLNGRGPRRARPARRRALKVEPLEERTVLSTICGFVYNDVNRDGVFETGEPVFANNVIQLYNSHGQLIAATTTGSDGHYEFTADQTINTTPTTKEVDAVFSQSKTNTTLQQSVAQFDPSLGTLTGVEIIDQSTLTSTASVESLDNAPTQVQVQLSGEATLSGGGLAGLKVSLSGAETANLSAFDGKFDFGGPSGKQFAPDAMTGSNSLMLTAGQNDLSAWIGAGSVTLNLEAEASSSVAGSGNLASIVSTNVSGLVKVIYHYTPSSSLKAGNYTVVQPQNPPGTFDGVNTASNGAVIAPWGGVIEYIPVTVTADGAGPTSESCNNNFGELSPGSLSGYAYYDANSDGWLQLGLEPGIGGVSIVLTGVDYKGQSLRFTTTTDQNGFYSFTNLKPGVYTLTKASTPAGYLDYVDQAGTLGGAAGHNVISQITLQSEQAGQYYDFGHVKPASASGYVYFDANKSGAFDSGDSGLGGVTVTLQGTNFLGQSVTLTAQTDATGFYQFGGLLPGNYAVTKTPPSGFLDGATNVGDLGGVAFGDTIWFTLHQADVGHQYNFGEVLSDVTTHTFVPNITTSPPIDVTTPPNGGKRRFLGDPSAWNLGLG